MLAAIATYLSLTGSAIETVNVNEEWFTKVAEKQREYQSIEEFGYGVRQMEKYGEFFDSYIRQHAVILMVSEWDWYLGHLRRFVTRCWKMESLDGKTKRPSVKSVSGDSKIEKSIRKLFVECEAEKWPFIPEEAAAWKELDLVRNLGIHGRWEVSKSYMKLSEFGKHFAPGDVRIPLPEEVAGWMDVVRNALTYTSIWAATRFADAPAYFGLED